MCTLIDEMAARRKERGDEASEKGKGGWEEREVREEGGQERKGVVTDGTGVDITQVLTYNGRPRMYTIPKL